jgi:hypothetical protein
VAHEPTHAQQDWAVDRHEKLLAHRLAAGQFLEPLQVDTARHDLDARFGHAAAREPRLHLLRDGGNHARELGNPAP